MESLAPALVDGMESVLDVLPAELDRRAGRPRARPHPRPRPRRDERRVPRGQLGQRSGRQQRARRPPVGARLGLLLDARPGARARRCVRTPVVDADPLQRRRRARHRGRRRRRPALACGTVDPEAFRGDTGPGRRPPARAGRATGGAVAVVTEGHGLAKRVDEVLREHEVARRPARRRRSRAAGPRHRDRRLSDGDSSTRPHASRCSPRPTSPVRSAARRRRRTCGVCRRVGATRSTRSSCGRATTSSTSSTASAVSSR